MSVNSTRNAFLAFYRNSLQFVQSGVFVGKVWSVASLISYLNKDYNFSSFYDHSFFPTLKIDGYCCTQSMIDVDIQRLYQEPRLPLGKQNTSTNTWLALISFVSVLVTECSNVTRFVFVTAESQTQPPVSLWNNSSFSCWLLSLLLIERKMYPPMNS